MGATFGWTYHRLRLVALVSTLSLIMLARLATAHEVTPTIADLSVDGGALTLDLRLNVEAFVAGIDLDGMEDTDVAEESGSYDALRALGPDELEPQVWQFAQAWVGRLRLEAGGPVPLSVARVEIPEVGNADLPRFSHLVLTGTVPPAARSLVLRWPDGAGDLVLRQQGVEDPFTGYIEGGQSSPPIPLAGGSEQSGWQVFGAYIPVGFDHILPKGLDHILFVLGLFFLSTRLRPLLWQVSAFTVAHTVTLALGALGLVKVSPGIVEPLIAASITYVALENLLTESLHRWRPAVIFGFGLLHGLGFASVLGEFGLPAEHFVPALLGFNIGVELGQLAVIALVFLAVGLWFRNRAWYRDRIAVPASVVIALVGAYWFVERVFF